MVERVSGRRDGSATDWVCGCEAGFSAWLETTSVRMDETKTTTTSSMDSHRPCSSSQLGAARDVGKTTESTEFTSSIVLRIL